MDLSKFRNLKSPYVIILVGPPLTGKSSMVREFIDKIDPDVEIISRDDIVLELSGSDDYSTAFNTVNQKQVDRELTAKLVNAGEEGLNTIIDMTHMTSKRRKQNLNFFGDDYYKMCVIFPFISDEEYQKRNQKRKAEENKDIPLHIVKRMMSQYQNIKPDEGFDKTISING